MPIITAFLTYFISQNLCVKLTGDYNREILQSKKNEINQIFNEASSFATELSFNYKVEQIADMTDFVTPEEQYMLYDIHLDWRSYYSVREHIENAYIYFPKSQYISGLFSSEKQNKFFMSEYPESAYTEWFQMLNTVSRGQIFTLEHIPKSVFYVQSIYNISDNLLSGNIIIELKLADLIETQSDAQGLHALIIVDEQSNVLLDNRPDRQNLPLEPEELEKIMSQEEVTIGGLNYIISVLPSDILNLQYIYLTNERLYAKEITGLRNVVLLSTLLCLVVSAYLIWFWVKKNHRPLRDIVNSITHYTKHSPDVDNEYQYIGETLLDAIQQKDSMEGELQKRQEILRQYSISRLLHNRDTEFTEQILGELGIVFHEKAFSVILFSVESVEGLFYEETNKGKEFELSQLIITNILGEMMGERFQCVTFAEEEYFGLIVNCPPQESSYKEMLEILNWADTFISSAFNLYYTTAVSSRHLGAETIRQCYNEAVITMDYRFTHVENDILEYSSVESSSQFSYNYPVEQEQSLINNLKAGNAEKCREIIQSIWDKNFSNGEGLVPVVGKCLVYDVLSTIAKTVNSMAFVNPPEDGHNKELFESVEKCESVLEKKEAIIRVVEDFCNRLDRDAVKSADNEEFVASIQAFIEENYKDKNLSVATIADHLNLTANYLSYVYKKKTDESLLERITKTRISKAKELMASRQITVEQLAGEVGYSSSKTFIRCFVKQEGITPGKFKGN